MDVDYHRFAYRNSREATRCTPSDHKNENVGMALTYNSEDVEN